jgi:hypothetical protein
MKIVEPALDKPHGEKLREEFNAEQQKAKALAMDSNCYNRARQRGEQTFTLVERDFTSPYVIVEWIKLNLATAPPEKLLDALRDAIAMQRSPIPKRDAD